MIPLLQNNKSDDLFTQNFNWIQYSETMLFFPLSLISIIGSLLCRQTMSFAVMRLEFQNLAKGST